MDKGYSYKEVEERLKVLSKMSLFNVETQIDVIIIVFALHNYLQDLTR